MKPKQAITLLAVVAVIIAGIAIYKLAIQPRQEQKTEAAGVMFPVLDTAKVDRIEIGSGEGLAALVRQGDSVWVVESAANYPADTDAIEKALDAVKALRKDLPASENKDNYSRLGVDDKGIKVKLLAGKTVVADLVVGLAGKNYGTTYARPAGSDSVYLVSQDLRATFPAGSSAWRDKAIFDLAMEDISEIRLWTDPNAKPPSPAPAEGGPAPGSTAAPAPALAAGSTAVPAAAVPATITPSTPGGLVIKKATGGEWTALKDGGTAEKLDPAKADALARALATMTAVEFADTVTPAKAGLATPTHKAEFVTTDGKTYTLLIGGPAGQDVYVGRGDSQVVFKVYPYNVDSIFKTVEELRPLPGGEGAGLPPPNMPGMGGQGMPPMPPGMVMPGMPEGGEPPVGGPTPPPIEPAPGAQPPASPVPAPGGSVKK
jgi:hypothetical protein